MSKTTCLAIGDSRVLNHIPKTRVCVLIYQHIMLIICSLVAQMVKRLSTMQEIWVQSLGRDLLEKEMAAHSSILAWKIPWTEEPGRATVHGVTKNQTWLSDFTFLSFNDRIILETFYECAYIHYGSFLKENTRNYNGSFLGEGSRTEVWNKGGLTFYYISYCTSGFF